MAEPESKPSPLERISEHGYRLDTILDLWAYAKPYLPLAVGSVVTGLVGAILQVRDHASGFQVFIGGLGSAAITAWAWAGVSMVKRNRAITEAAQQRAAVETEQAAQLHPTRDILEEGRKAQFAKREALIAKWRAMVFDVHRQLNAGPGDVSTTQLLEDNLDFLTFRPYMSDHTHGAIYGRMMVVPPSQSTMNGGLLCILRDVDALAKQWFVD
jgi:hypothetical protein